MGFIRIFFIAIILSSGITLSHAENPAVKISPAKQEVNSNNFGSLKYTLGPGDVIGISVRNHPEFSGTYPINLEGKIQYSYVGNIDVRGLTQGELEEKLEKNIATYVVSPQVNVTILEYESKVFFVLGEVAKPGQYHMHSQTISVEDAVIMAGLPIRTAAINKARIITPGLDGGTFRKVNLYNLLFLGDLKENVLLKPGDSLIVPAAVTESVENKKVIDSNFDPLKYTLGPEDVIAIKVIDHPDFSGIYAVNLEGKIQYAFVGDIDVTGLTRGQLERKIKTILSPYVVSPEINVTITEFKSKIFFVLGQVFRPGKYHMSAEIISVRDAVIMAGLPSKTAALDKAKVITPGPNGGTVKEVNLNALLYNGDLRENLFLHPGDSLYVPRVANEFAEDRNLIGNFDPLKYTLGPDDVVQITVMDRPDFSGTYPISLEGKIQYKFVGDMDVRGMTKRQLEEKIKQVISVYVVSPEVNVTITEFKSKVFYVLGEVGAPGKYFMRADHITVSEAVVMAGLPTVEAAMRKTRIITPSMKGPITRNVNLYDLLYFGDLKENLLINPGDYLYVPATVLAKVIRIVSPVSTTIGLAVGPAVDAGNAKQVLTPYPK